MRQTMRALVVVAIGLAMPACDDIIDDDDGSCRRSADCSDDTSYPDPVLVDCPGLARCEAGGITAIAPGMYPEYCPADAGEEVGRCERGCLEPVVYCIGDAACEPSALLETMCYVPAPIVACTDDGAACTDEGTARACDAVAVCETAYGTGACACEDGAWQCDVPCTDGLCSAAAVQDAIVGTWHGTADAVFRRTWDLTLEILPDHHYIGDAETDDGAVSGAFYYGFDGELELQWIDITSQTPDGAVGRVNLGYPDGDSAGAEQGTIHQLRVTADTLTFTFTPPFGCGYEIAYVLTRVVP